MVLARARVPDALTAPPSRRRGARSARRLDGGRLSVVATRPKRQY
jgi:hypothetical protein